jgi:hypothetical protein
MSASRWAWTAAGDVLLRQHYPHSTTAAAAALIGCSLAQAYRRAAKLGLRKTAAWLASEHSGRGNLRSTGAATRFAAGQAPWNRGLEMPSDHGGQQTQFAPGHKPANWLPVGALRWASTGRIRYWQVKVTDTGYPPADWVMLHRQLWLAHYPGPLPATHVVAFKPGTPPCLAPADVQIGLLEVISRAESMRRNSCHRYPRELAQLVQLRSVLTRQINQQARAAQDGTL